MSIQYPTDKERKLHGSVIHSLADHYHLDERMIREVYESELESLMDGARVRSYLPLLAERHVRNLLHQQVFGGVYSDHLH